MWSKEFIENREKVIDIKKNLEYLEGTKLNLGCGNEIIPRFINIDKYFDDIRVIKADLLNLPYNEIDYIYASHVLEHFPIRHAKMALREWYRVLKNNGTLYLAIPDLEIIMLKLLDSSLPNEYHDWFLYTLFGYQIDTNIRGNELNHPLDLGQFHQTGFTKHTIQNELTSVGFKIKSIFNYDGWDTPSIWVEAYK